jgi:thiosulfate/3-mercaptopyruvate sulfurtransferase
MADLLLPDLRQNLDVNHIEQLLSRSGITNETTVIAYGSYPGTGAWIFWLLKLFGHSDVRVLDGGHQKWIAESRPVSSKFSTFVPVEYRRMLPSSGINFSESVARSATLSLDSCCGA